MSNVLLVIFLPSIVGANADNSFWHPPEKTDKILEYDIDQTLQILWQTNFKSYSLVLQQVGTNSRQFIELNMAEKRSWDWIVQTEIDLLHPFYFIMYDAYNDMNTFSCNPFKILSKNDTTTTMPSSTNPSTSTGSSDSSSGTGTSTGSSNPSSGTGTSTLALGVGIGVGVCCAFFIALAAIIWYFRRRKAAAATAPELNASTLHPAWSLPRDTQDPSKRMPPPVEVPGYSAVAEVPSDRVRYELPS